MSPRLLTLLGAYLALATAHCTFPSYSTPPGSGGSAGAGGGTAGGGAANLGGVPEVGGAPEIGGASEVGGTPGEGGTSGEGGTDTAGGSPECAPEQWPVDRCQAGCLHRFADHCYDGKTSADELDVDCGGSCQGCTNEPCAQGTECLSGHCALDVNGVSSCHAPLTVDFTMNERNSTVGSTSWSITLTNSEPASGEAFKLSDLKLRYYFKRSGITEPLLVRATQSGLTPMNGTKRTLLQTTWTVERVESLPGGVYDALVEVGFGDSGQLSPGDHIDLYQQMLTGDPSNSAFDQFSNYSFTDQAHSAWKHVTVFYADKLVWGLEPRPANPRACFARAINLNGPGLAVGSHDFESAAQALIVTNGAGVNPSGAPFPFVTGGLASMLQTATRLQTGGELSLPVDNGTYLAYLYATSPTSDDAASVFTVQGVGPDIGSKFRSQTVDGGPAWSQLGPFRIDVVDGKLRLGVTSGAVSFAGIELWYPD